MIEIIGQALGIIAVILGFVSYQMKTPRGILIFQLTTASIFAVHYLLIGAYTAMALNLLCAISCLFYYFIYCFIYLFVYLYCIESVSG